MEGRSRLPSSGRETRSWRSWPTTGPASLPTTSSGSSGSGRRRGPTPARASASRSAVPSPSCTEGHSPSTRPPPAARVSSSASRRQRLAHEPRSPSARSRGGNHVSPTSPLLRCCGGTSRFPHTPSTASWARGWPMSRILVVDDESVVRGLVAELLHGAGHEVVIAASGEEALALLDGVDLLVCDVGLPGVSGEAVVEAARTRRPGLPAVLMTGDPAESRPAALAKPFTPSDLLDAVAAALGDTRFRVV